MDNFNPKIVAFVCNWCSYAGADKAGGQKMDYSPNVKLIKVMCSGRMEPQLVMQAFREGADGVMVLGCHPGDCHYRNGNHKALRRFKMFEKLLDQVGIDRKRFMLDWVAAGEAERFQKVTNQMNEQVTSLGPLEIKGFVEKEVV